MHLLSGAVESAVASGDDKVLRGAQDGNALGLVQRVEVLEELVQSLQERLKVLEDCGVFSQG